MLLRVEFGSVIDLQASPLAEGLQHIVA